MEIVDKIMFKNGSVLNVYCSVDDLPYKKNDNLTALAMQHCALQICEGIEVDDTKKIASALADLKQCTENFEAIFYDNLINNRYRS